LWQETNTSYSPDEANLKGKIGFIFAGTTALSIIWVFFRVPETAGRSVNDLDRLFAAKVPARQFKKYRLDPQPEAQRSWSTASETLARSVDPLSSRLPAIN